MVYCVQAELAFASSARRDGVLVEVRDRLALRPRWGVDALEPSTSKAGDPALRISARLTVEADADDVEAWLRARLTGPRTPRDGSWLRVHRCAHDELALAECPPGRQAQVLAGAWVVV